MDRFISLIFPTKPPPPLLNVSEPPKAHPKIRFRVYLALYIFIYLVKLVKILVTKIYQCAVQKLPCCSQGQECLFTQNFTRKMKAGTDLLFGWNDIHIDGDLKNMILDNVTRPLRILKTFPKASVSLPKGVLFSGPSGTGKTLLAMIMAKESHCNFLSVDASDIKNSYYGLSEKEVKSIFSVAESNAPCILFIDEVDTILYSSDHNSSGYRSRADESIKGAFLTCWDGIETKNEKSSVIVIGTTNRPKSLDPAFLRRFDLQMEMALPDLVQRQKILEIIFKEKLLEDNFNIKQIAEQAAGFSGSDLAEAVRYAVVSCNCNTEYLKQLELEADIKQAHPENRSDKNEVKWWHFPPLPFFKKYFLKKEPSQEYTTTDPPKIPITMANMENSIAHYKKSRFSGGGVGGLDSIEMLITSNLVHPCDLKTTWEDIAGCDEVIRDIKKNLLLPMELRMNTKKFKVSKFLQCPKGILFHGPPGSGKTLLAKAIARHSGCTFINLQPSTLESKWYGETSQRTAALFSVAEKYQPCIIFMDEIDAYLREHRASDSEWSAAKKAQFLSLLDGILTDPDKVIILMGATSRISDLDPALLRRLTLKFHIESPDRNKRRDILQLLLKDENLSDDVCLERLVDITEEMTGSDLKDILRATNIEAWYTNYPSIVEKDIQQSKQNGSERKDYWKNYSGERIDDNNNADTDKANSTCDMISIILGNTLDAVTKSPGNINVECSSRSVSKDCVVEPPVTVEIEMSHFITVIENFKKSRANPTGCTEYDI